VASGRIQLSTRKPLAERLVELHEVLASIIREYGPTRAVVEKVFFAKSVKSALTLGQVRGVVLLAAAAGGLKVHEYSPLEVKKAVTGYGRAEKRQVQDMVSKLLDISIKLSTDSADALALALCYINSERFEGTVGRR
jgi:crossover junction endodeoxyribonuclease RuvC